MTQTKDIGAQPLNSKVRNNVLLLSAGMFFVFFSFQAAQNFATSREGFETEGGISLGIVYMVFTFTNFISAYTVGRLGSKITLFMGGAGYTIWLAGQIYYIPVVVYIVSAILGCGASFIWTASGYYMIQCSQFNEAIYKLPDNSTAGIISGIFWSIYNFNNFLGNLMVALLFQFDVPLYITFICLTAIAIFGACLFGGLSKMESSQLEEEKKLLNVTAETPESDPDLDHNIQNTKPEQTSVYEVFRLWKSPSLIAMIPMFVYSGLSLTFMYGEFPPLIEQNNEKFYTMAVFGFTNTISAIAIGKLSDFVGRIPCIFIAFVAHLFVYVTLWIHSYGLYEIQQSQLYFWMILAAALGIGDAGFNTQIYALISSLFGDCPAVGHANFRLFQSGATSVAFFYRDALSFNQKVIVSSAWMVAGFLFILLSRRVRDAARSTVRV